MALARARGEAIGAPDACAFICFILMMAVVLVVVMGEDVLHVYRIGSAEP